MANIRFSIGPECAGGNHFDVTVTLGTHTVTLHSTFPEMNEELTPEELDDFIPVLLRFLVSEHPSNVRAAIRARLSAANVVLRL